MRREKGMKAARFPCKFTPGSSHPGQYAGIPPYKRFFQQMGRGRGTGMAKDDSSVYIMGGLEMAQRDRNLWHFLVPQEVAAEEGDGAKNKVLMIFGKTSNLNCPFRLEQVEKEEATSRALRI